MASAPWLLPTGTPGAKACGSFIVKRLADAVDNGNGNSIYAVIRGSSVMQDGKSASLTAPNGRMQEKLIRAVLREAGKQASDIHYLEAHGTGTPLGDPIEMASVAAVYGEGRSEDSPLYVSSAKANVGHLEGAAGTMGLMAARQYWLFSTQRHLLTVSWRP